MRAKPTICRHFDAFYEILQNERAFELLLFLPFLQHEDHICNRVRTTSAIGQSLVSISKWLRDQSAIALFDIGYSGVIVRELLVGGRPDPVLLADLEALCAVEFP